MAREKNHLRAKFIDFGCSSIFALHERGYQSDLFDPRTGYPLLARRGLAVDDNAVVKAVLNYPVTSDGQCSLLTHPAWANSVYPSTLVTSAPHRVIEQCIPQIADNFSWTLKS